MFIIALGGTLLILPLMLGVFSMWALTHPPCAGSGNPASFSSDYEDVRFFSTQGLDIEGYFIPGTNGATVIIPPAYSSDRGGSLHYAEVFNRDGFSVLTFESRVCTALGWISLGYYEIEDVQAAYDYLKTRPDIDPMRVSLHGFSSAGATSLMATAAIPEIRAVSAEGGYHDFGAVMGIGETSNFFNDLYRFAARGTYRLITGTDMENLSPIGAIERIGARPVLLVYGSREVSLPGARQMLARAQALNVPAALWIVEGAGHGNYLTIAPEEFVRRVVGFHKSAQFLLT